MNSITNVVALNTTPTALIRPTHFRSQGSPAVRTTAAFRALMAAPINGAELALLRIILRDVENGGLSGYITWSVDEVCNTLVIRQWPSTRVLDIVPFPVSKLTGESRKRSFVAAMNSEMATLGIVGDPDPALRDEDGHAIGSRIRMFP